MNSIKSVALLSASSSQAKATPSAVEDSPQLSLQANAFLLSKAHIMMFLEAPAIAPSSTSTHLSKMTNHSLVVASRAAQSGLTITMGEFESIASYLRSQVASFPRILSHSHSYTTQLSLEEVNQCLADLHSMATEAAADSAKFSDIVFSQEQLRCDRAKWRLGVDSIHVGGRSGLQISDQHAKALLLVLIKLRRFQVSE